MKFKSPTRSRYRMSALGKEGPGHTYLVNIRLTVPELLYERIKRNAAILNRPFNLEICMMLYKDLQTSNPGFLDVSEISDEQEQYIPGQYAAEAKSLLNLIVTFGARGMGLDYMIVLREYTDCKTERMVKLAFRELKREGIIEGVKPETYYERPGLVYWRAANVDWRTARRLVKVRNDKLRKKMEQYFEWEDSMEDTKKKGPLDE